MQRENLKRAKFRKEDQGNQISPMIVGLRAMRGAENSDQCRIPLRLCPDILTGNGTLIEGPDVSFCCCHRSIGEVPEHVHDQLEIAVLFEPAACVLTWATARRRQQQCSVRAPALIMVAPRLLHACHWEREADIALMYLEPALHKVLLPAGLPSGSAVVPIAAHDLALWQLANALRNCEVAREPRLVRVVTSIGVALATYAVELLGRAAIEPVRRLADALLRQIEDFVTSHLSANICTDDMASHVGYSVPHFSTLFKGAKGITPIEYLFRQRMEKAKDLLRSGNYTIGEVARKVSYVDQGNFAEKFRAYHGVSAKQVIGQSRVESSDRPKLS